MPSIESPVPQPISSEIPPESVWDYPRPPAVRPEERLVQVHHRGLVVASTRTALRVLETSHPPTFYLPADSVRTELLRPEPGTSVCEWKGTAVYWSLEIDGHTTSRAAWTYPAPRPGYEALAGHFAFYPSRIDRCEVGGMAVTAQAGDFYGGWITPEIAGPFKGGPGTWGW